MSFDANMVQYRDEAIMGYEQGISLLKGSVTSQAQIKGNSATFLVADSGSATPSTRGVNGLIPARTDSGAQFTATLVEWHDLVRRTSFDMFANQGDGRRIMQMTTRKTMNRKVDQDILAGLQNGTLTTGNATTASLNLVMHAYSILGNNAVPMEEIDNLFFVVSPGFMAYLMQVPEFNKGEYVSIKHLDGPAKTYYRQWFFNWIVHPNIVGKGTVLEYCFAYHRDSIGHAVNTGEMQALAGYHQEQDYSWARTTCFMGSKLLQNNGVVVVKHDGSAFAAV